jgi:anti-anti-sigma factor
VAAHLGAEVTIPSVGSLVVSLYPSKAVALELAVIEDFEVPAIAVEGEADHFTSMRLAETAEAALEGGEGRIIFDLSSCPFMYCGGLVLLLALLERVGPRGWVGVVGPNPDILRVLEMVGLTRRADFRVFSRTGGGQSGGQSTPEIRSRFAQST